MLLTVYVCLVPEVLSQYLLPWSLLDLRFRLSSALLAESSSSSGRQVTPGLEYVYIWSRERTGCSRTPSTHQAGGRNIEPISSPDVIAGYLEQLGLPLSPQHAGFSQPRLSVLV